VKRTLSKLFTQAHWSHSVLHCKYLKLADAFLPIHSCFFSRSIKLRGLTLSAVSHCVATLPATMSAFNSNMRQTKHLLSNLKRTSEDLLVCNA